MRSLVSLGFSSRLAEQQNLAAERGYSRDRVLGRVLLDYSFAVTGPFSGRSASSTRGWPGTAVGLLYMAAGAE
jgi:hypothetical protein